MGENRSQMVKIGHTTRHPTQRALEITTVSGLVKPCTVAYMIQVDDCKAVERAAHSILASRRIRGRELFKTDVETAIAAVQRANIHRSPVWNDQRPNYKPPPYADRPLVPVHVWIAGIAFMLTMLVVFGRG